MKRFWWLLWAAGPWVGLAFFVRRQQTLEANLSAWVQATNSAMQQSMGRFADAASAHAMESEHGRVHE